MLIGSNIEFVKIHVTLWGGAWGGAIHEMTCLNVIMSILEQKFDFDVHERIRGAPPCAPP